MCACVRACACVCFPLSQREGAEEQALFDSLGRCELSAPHTLPPKRPRRGEEERERIDGGGARASHV